MMFFLAETVDVFERLVILRIPLLIAHIIATCFLLFILVYFVYKPFKKWFIKREKHFAEKQSQIKENLNKAESLRQEQETKLAKSKFLIENMMQKSKENLKIERKIILKSAEKTRMRIIDNANSLSNQKKNSLKKEINETIINNSLLLVKKILNSEINPEKHQELIEEFIQELAKKDNFKKKNQE